MLQHKLIIENSDEWYSLYAQYTSLIPVLYNYELEFLFELTKLN